MDGPGEFYAKLKKQVRERLVPSELTHMWNRMNKINKQNRNRLTDNRLTVLRGEGVGELGEKGEGVKQKTQKNLAS